jgi:hypothetical protein
VPRTPAEEWNKLRGAIETRFIVPQKKISNIGNENGLEIRGDFMTKVTRDVRETC